MPAKKLVLTYVDSLRTDMLELAIAEGRAPTFSALIERGVLIPDCVSSFPSVTPVASAEMVTGVGSERHWISGMNWYHRLEQRYVEYGSSLEATRAFGVFRTLYDLVYNMNLAHLNPEVETLFERLDDVGRAHRLHALPDLPRAPSSRGLPRRSRCAAPSMRRTLSSTITPGGRASSSTATSTPAARFHAGRPRSPAAAIATRPAARRVGERRALRFPPFRAARQRQLLAPTRPAGKRRVDRQGRPLLRVGCSRRQAGSTRSCRSTR